MQFSKFPFSLNFTIALVVPVFMSTLKSQFLTGKVSSYWQAQGYLVIGWSAKDRKKTEDWDIFSDFEPWKFSSFSYWNTKISGLKLLFLFKGLQNPLAIKVQGHVSLGVKDLFFSISAQSTLIQVFSRHM